MTKYLIIALVILILITGLVLIINLRSQPQTSPQSPFPSSTSKPSVPGLIPNPSSYVTSLPSDDYQAQADKNYADALKEQDQAYPWLQQMPLQTTNYFVYFETSNNTFTAKIYDPAQSEQIKQEILNRLTALNIDTTKYNINWQIKPR